MLYTIINKGNFKVNYIKQQKLFKNLRKQFKKEVELQDSFIEDMDYFRGYVTFKEHNLVIIDKEKILTKTEILDFAINFCSNKNFNIEKFSKEKKVNITKNIINETPTFVVQRIQTLSPQLEMWFYINFNIAIKF